MRKLLLLSTSTVHGSTFLEYCMDEVKKHFSGLKKILFIPYARPGGISYDGYTEIVRKALAQINIEVVGVHELTNIQKEIGDFGGIYIGGGNTFLLIKSLYENDLIPLIRDGVMSRGVKYMGSSAGTNVACQTINNTNDMPIVFPPSFDALKLIPFNINPHYLDPDPNSKHMGETRETRINEFHSQSKIPVLGLREGSWLKIDGDEITLGGGFPARLFEQNKEARELTDSNQLNYLLKAR
jgi:dipeptidase E